MVVCGGESSGKVGLWIFDVNPPFYHWHGLESSLIWWYNHRLKELSPNNSLIKALFIRSAHDQVRFTQALKKAPVGWADEQMSRAANTQSLMWLSHWLLWTPSLWICFNSLAPKLGLNLTCHAYEANPQRDTTEIKIETFSRIFNRFFFSCGSLCCLYLTSWSTDDITCSL